MKSPRQYQIDLVEKARQKLREIAERLASQGVKRKPRLMIQLGCGGGKTFLASMITQSTIDRGGTTQFLVHRDFLLEQTSATYAEMGISHSYVAAGRWLNQWDSAHIGMIGSMKSRMKKIKAPKLCFFDEGHHGVAKTWQAIMDAWPDTTFIFLSATPGARSDGKGLDAVCDDIVCGPSNAELIRMGALSDYVYYAPSAPDLSGLHVRMGEYVVDEIDEEMSKAVIVGDIVQSYTKHAFGTKAIYFATSIKTSKMYAEAFNSAGIRAEHIDADTSSFDRKRYARMMADGELDIMTNCGIATEGFDLAAQAGKDVTIETVGLCRPTKSLPLLIQMEMRAMRAKPYPGIILDHGGCYKEHNFLPDDDIEWSLAGGKKSSSGEIKLCDNCGAAIKRFSISCLSCGAVISEAKQRGKTSGRVDIEHVEGELEKIDKDRLRKEKKLEEWHCGSMQELQDLAKRRGYKDPLKWAGLIWTSREQRKRAKEYADKQQLDFYQKVGMA